MSSANCKSIDVNPNRIDVFCPAGDTASPGDYILATGRTTDNVGTDLWLIVEYESPVHRQAKTVTR